MLKDQYGGEVPSDLVVLPTYSQLLPNEVAAVFRARWYKCDGVLMASLRAIPGLSEIDPEDCGVCLDENSVIERIAAPLKRGSKEDGFYHA